MKLLLILFGVSGVLSGGLPAAQTCECSGGFSGTDCKQCQYFVPKVDAPACDYMSLAIDDTNKKNRNLARARRAVGDPTLSKLTAVQLACHSIASFDLNLMKCDCPETHEGDYCERCVATKTNWPSCNQDSCSVPTACGSDKGATCDPEPLNFAPCGNNKFKPSTQECCMWDDETDPSTKLYRTITKFNVVDGKKEATGDTCCGSLVCSYGETCIDNKFCLPAGEEQCNQEIENDEGDPTVVTYGSCLPYETCCHGTCCSGDSTCQKEANTMRARLDFLKPGEAEDGAKYHDYQIHKCVASTYLSSPSSIKIGLQPFMVMVTVLGSLGLVIKTTGMGAKAISIPAVFNCVMTAFFLVFHRMWLANFMLAIGSLISIGAQAAESKWKHVVSVIIQFVFFAAFNGGLGLGSDLVDSFQAVQSNANLDNPASWNEMASCSSYYGYFTYSNNQPWDVESRYWGYCSHGWLSFIAFAQIIVTSLYFFQLASSAIAMVVGPEALPLQGGKTPKTKKTEPAAPVGDIVTPVMPDGTTPAEP